MTKFDNLIYDVGMHKGEDTNYYLKKGFKVIGFEADPSLAEFCRKRFAKELERGKLIIVEGAIIDFTDHTHQHNKVKFFRNKDNSVWGTVNKNWAIRNETLGTTIEAIEVSAIDFTECLNQYGIPYYLKIDIEGMDTICLKSLLNFQDKPSYISIESEKVNFKKLKGEFDLFHKNGYDKFQVINQAIIDTFKESKTNTEGIYANFDFEFDSSGPFGRDLPYGWITSKNALSKYKWIFYSYTLFGDNSKITKYRITRLFLRNVNRVLKKHIPGWYDTHAKHSTIK
jgi:FkbM family methyltransferase